MTPTSDRRRDEGRTGGSAPRVSGRRLEPRPGGLDAVEAELLAVPVAEEAPWLEAVDARYGGVLARLRERELIRPGRDEARLAWAGSEDRPDLLAVTLADGEGPDPLRRAAGVAVRKARTLGARSLAFLVPAREAEAWQASAEGLLLGDWSFDELQGEATRGRRPDPPVGLELVSPEPSEGGGALAPAVERGRVLAEAQNGARRLVAQPGNIVTPRRLAAAAEELGDRWGFRVTVWGPERLRREGFGALLAVARGSVEEPQFLILEHGEGAEPPAVVVGKGVTFDSGGISLKPSGGMESMKYDMAGAAAVLGIMEGAARLSLPGRVVGLVPATENLPSGSALKPGDVIRGLSGTSIEVVNTDAEGRLILSDALTYARRLEPRAVVDLATLTGGCVVALGHHAMGLMSPDDGLAAALEAAGRQTGERAWRLPLWKAYRRQLDSDIADLKNAAGREGSPVTAAAFLQEFAGTEPWAHLDIAGVAWAEEGRGWQPEGATGVGVRLVLEWLTAGA